MPESDDTPAPGRTVGGRPYAFARAGVPVSRRHLSAADLVGLLPPNVAGPAPQAALLSPGSHAALLAPAAATVGPVEYVRDEDLLVVRVTLYHFADEGAAGFRRLAGPAAFVAFDFAAQHLAEANAATGGGGEPLFAVEPIDPPENRSHPEGEGVTVDYSHYARRPTARLVFSVPADVERLGPSLEALLDWSRLRPSLAFTAASAMPTLVPPGAGRPFAPSPLMTAVQIPYGVLLSPTDPGRWAHARAPVVRNGRAEVWHTRLTAVDGLAPTLRAIWTREDDAEPTVERSLASTDTSKLGVRVPVPRARATGRAPGPEPRPPADTDPWNDGARARFVPDADARRDLPALTADHSRPGLPPAELAALPLVVSPLGATFATHAAFTPAQRAAADGATLERWAQRTVVARDVSVLTVQTKCILPLGHRVRETKAVRRVLKPNASGVPVAVLEEETTVDILEPVRRYHTHADPRFPFASVAITSLRFDRLLSWQPGTAGDLGFHRYTADGSPALLSCVGEDAAGRLIPFTYPLLIAPPTASPGEAEGVRLDDPAVTAGGPLTYVTDPGDGATVETDRLWFRVVAADAGGDAEAVRFRPQLDEAEVRVPALAQLRPGYTSTRLRYHPAFAAATAGQAPTAAQPWAAFADEVIDLSPAVAGPASPGILAPALSVNALSAAAGLLNAAADEATGLAVRASAIVDDLPFLGGTKLKDLVGGALEPVDVTTDRDGATLTTRIVYESPGDAPKVRLEAEAVVAAGAPPRMRASGDVSGLSLRFPAKATADEVKLEVRFGAVHFAAASGEKTQFTLRLDPGSLRFRNGLAFLNVVAALIPFDGFSNPPYVDVTASGARVGYSVGLPPVSAGIFALKNVELDALLELPFGGGPATFDLRFGRPERPFLVVVKLFAGSGSCRLGFDADGGLTAVDLSLGFGGVFEVDVGVARGGVSVLGQLVVATGDAEGLRVTGTLTVSGGIEVLNLIGITVNQTLVLTYVPSTGLVEAAATFTVTVHIGFFSKSVSFGLSWQLAGPEDPGPLEDPGRTRAGRLGGASPAARLAPGLRAPHAPALVAPAGDAPAGDALAGDALALDTWRAYAAAFA